MESCLGSELTGHSADEMLGTGNHFKPFYSVTRPMIADLIVDSDMDGLSKHYGTKNVKNPKRLGAYEATDYYANLGGQSRYLYFLAAPIYDEEAQNHCSGWNIAGCVAWKRDDEEPSANMPKRCRTNWLRILNSSDRFKDLNNYLQTIITSLPDRIYEIDEKGIINFMSRGLRKKDRHIGWIQKQIFFGLCCFRLWHLVLSKWEEAKKGIYKPYEIEAIGKDGCKHNLSITTTPVIGTDHYIIVQRDITELGGSGKKTLRQPEARGPGTTFRRHRARNTQPSFLH